MIVSTISKRFIKCPCCNSYEFQVEHLLDGSFRHNSFGPWSCDNDECDAVINGWITNGQIEINVRTREHPRGLALLRLGNLFLVVEERYARTEPNHTDFFYHSHQCPTNLLREVEQVFDPSGRDPHGRLRFIANVEDNTDARQKLDECGTLAELFTMFGTDGTSPETEWPEENGGMLPFIAEWHREAAKKGDA